METSGEPAGYCCPGCGEPSPLVISPQQAFCGSEGCRVLMWDPSLTAEENFARMVQVRLPGPGESR